MKRDMINHITAPIRRVPIRSKLILVTMTTATVAVQLALAVGIALDYSAFRHSLAADFDSTAALVAANSTGALTFGDGTSAEETLSALAFKPSVSRACLYDDADNLIASYSDGKLGNCQPTAPVVPEIATFADGQLTLGKSISHDNQRLGALHVASDLDELAVRVTGYRTLASSCSVSASWRRWHYPRFFSG